MSIKQEIVKIREVAERSPPHPPTPTPTPEAAKKGILAKKEKSKARV